MTVATTTYRFRYNLLRHLPGLALLLAAIAMVLLALGPIGWRAGWWHFRVGFFYLMPWAGYFGIAAVLVSVLAFVLGRAVIGRRGVAIGIIACIAGGVAAYTPIHYYAMRGSYPAIDDITTDTVNPPAFVAMVAAAWPRAPIWPHTRASESPSNNGAPTLISHPWPSQYPPAQAFSHALDTAQRMGWTIVDGDPVTGRIEANDRSRWFGFTDDIVIRIAASGAGSKIDIRSSSRHGRGDFGVNAARIRSYLAALRQSVGGQS